MFPCRTVQRRTGRTRADRRFLCDRGKLPVRQRIAGRDVLHRDRYVVFGLIRIHQHQSQGECHRCRHFAQLFGDRADDLCAPRDFRRKRRILR
ncbi:hypothetical protein D1872_295700 [compost metagenome]